MNLFYLGILGASLMIVLGAILISILNQRLPKSLGFLQAISGGMLLSVVFFGIIPEAREATLAASGDGIPWVLMLAIIGGTFVLPLFEKILPVQHHHEFTNKEEHTNNKVAFILLSAFGIHSIFELVAVLVTGTSDPLLGWSLVFIIGLHNIPIGFIIYAQLEIYVSSSKKIIGLIFILVFSQCIIAILIYFLLMPFISELLIGVLLGITAGVMIYLTFDELLPEIYACEKQHSVNACIILGIILMFFIISL